MPQPRPTYEYKAVYPVEETLDEFGARGWRVVPGIVVYGEVYWANKVLMEREINASVV